MKFQYLNVTTKNNLMTVELNRPEKRNALNKQLLEEMYELFSGFEEKEFPGVRGIILTGSGDKAFVAGADIKEMSAMTPEDNQKFAELAQQVTLLMEELPVPIIACVDGVAFGGGCEFAMACDFIYATESSFFGQPEVGLGLIPCFGGCVRLPRFVGVGKAREMIYTGEAVSAVEAFQIKLVNKVFFTREDMMRAAEKQLQKVAEKSPTAVAISKSVINASLGQPVEFGLKKEAIGFFHATLHEESKKGMGAFLSKQKFNFSKDMSL